MARMEVYNIQVLMHVCWRLSKLNIKNIQFAFCFPFISCLERMFVSNSPSSMFSIEHKKLRKLILLISLLLHATKKRYGAQN